MSLRLMSAIIPQATSENHGETRARLLDRLLDGVKQCQVRYGGKTELASERDVQVADLCGSLEAVLSHGLRTTALTTDLSSSTLRHVSNLITSRLNLSSDGQVFWHFILLFLTRHERERYSMLKNICTDNGRGRAWIRGSLNERSLERYFHCMLDSSDLLEAHYEDWALMRDQEKNSMFTNMIAGLNSILFAINIDNQNLNTSAVETKSYLKNMRNEPVIITHIPERTENPRRQNRRVVRQIISFDDDGDTYVEQYSDDSVTLNKMDNSSICEDEVPAQDPTNNDEEIRQDDHTLTPVVTEELDSDKEFFPDETCSTSESSAQDEGSMSAVSGQEDKEDKDDDNSNVLRSLTKENDILKSQLKRYVSAVQLLKNNKENAHQTFDTLGNTGQLPDSNAEVKQYESKLIQVAEMHAELMEFNEYLQKQLNFKDSVIDHLKRQLRDDHKTYTHEERTQLRGEVYLTIPSAFLTGKGSTAHHVYQIHIRAGNNEWNIYRRYSHFYALHTELKKIDPNVSKYPFPPKKTIGNKDMSLVENRRKLLEEYIRNILEHWPELGACSSRTALEQHLAFFREPSIFENIKKTNQRTFLGNRSGSSDAHYNGL